jgi:hypothetical protein
MKALAIIALAGCYFQMVFTASAGAGHTVKEIVMTNDGPKGSYSVWKTCPYGKKVVQFEQNTRPFVECTDSDTCLQGKSWGRNSSPYYTNWAGWDCVNSIGYCDSYPADMNACCPATCGECSGDNTAVNGFGIFCETDGTLQNTANEYVSGVLSGTWEKSPECLTGFTQMDQKVMAPNGDSTSLNTADLFGCGQWNHPVGGVSTTATMEGSWGTAASCGSNQYICGFRTKLDPSRGPDATGNNGVEFQCCEECASGKYQQVKLPLFSASAHVCSCSLNCALRYQYVAGTTACQYCPAGKYTDGDTGQTSCRPSPTPYPTTYPSLYPTPCECL